MPGLLNKRLVRLTLPGVPILALVVYLSLQFLARPPGIKPLPQVKERGIGSTFPLSVKGINYNEYKDGQRKFSIQANSAVLRNRKLGFFRVALLKVTELEEVRVEFYDKDKVFFTIESQRATMPVPEGDVSFEKQVVSYSADGRQLKTERLRWNKKTDRLVAEGPFTFRTGDKAVEGNGMTTDVGFKRLSYVIRWQAKLVDSGNPVNVELELFRNGNIEFRYGSGNTFTGADSPSYATVGISNYGVEPQFARISMHNRKTNLNNAVTLFHPLVYRPYSLFPPVRKAMDFDGDGKADPVVLRNIGGVLNWFVWRSSSGTIIQQGWGNLGLGDMAVPGDYDGDNKADFAVWRRTTGQWIIRQSSTGTTLTIAYGSSAAFDAPVPADYDGDGKTDIAVRRAPTGTGTATWYIRNSSTGLTTTRVFGFGSDRPVPGNYDADARADIAVWRPSTGYWYILQSTTGTVVSRVLGSSAFGDIPVPGDYDGDGKVDSAVWRQKNSTWYILKTSTGTVDVMPWGSWQAAGGIPVPLDIDGDGKTDRGMWFSATGTWIVPPSGAGAGGWAQRWGMPEEGDRPLGWR